MAVPEKVLNWLYSVLTSEYTDVNRTYNDASEVLARYPSLHPRTEIYTYENGSSVLLLQLTGTLPVNFRGATYNYPLAIWVPHMYPHESPIVYMTPSADMVVRAGQHVSGDGRVYHPYLAQWGQYWDKSTLFDFLAILRGVFVKEPPMRSRQQQQPRYNTPSQPTPPPVPPPPVTGPSNQPSAPPPKPPKPGEQNRPTPPHNDRYSHPPPLPPHPPQQSHPQQLHPLHRAIHGAAPGWQQEKPQVPPVSVPQSQHYARPPPTPQQQYPQPPPPPQHPPQHQPQAYPLQQHLNYQHQTHPPPQAPPAPTPPVDLLDDSLQVTLPSQLSRPTISVPPVPPNPEKDALLRALSETFVAQIRQTVTTNTSANGPLQAQQQALQTAHARLQSELGELQQLDSALASNEQVLKGAMMEADRVMEDARQREVPDVDDVLVAPTLVGGQLYTLAAEEKGIADAIFVLGRALDKGRVGTDVFVKQTRSLAREQFMKKALIKKIATGMALDAYQLR